MRQLLRRAMAGWPEYERRRALGMAVVLAASTQVHGMAGGAYWARTSDLRGVSTAL